jgi:hypothetical protein
MLYDFFSHELTALPAMPEPRVGAVAGICGSDCTVVALGQGPDGLATDILRFDGEAWQSFPDGLSPAERRGGAAAARLADGSYLIVGGSGPSGDLDTALVLDPGEGTHDPMLALSPARMHAPRKQPVVAVGSEVVLVAGGQPGGEAPVELFYESSSAFQTVDLSGPAPVEGVAAVALADGRFVVTGGRDASGTLLADAWIIDPIAIKVEHHPDVLSQPRAGHTAARLGQHLVLVGGETESGAAERAEVLSAATLARVAQPPEVVRLGRPVLVPLGVGSLLAAGGTRADGTPVRELEVYERATLLVE